MPSKDSNFISINIHKHLIKDIDKEINRNEDLRLFTNRAGFIAKIISDFLDKRAYEREKDLPKGKKSARARRYELTEWWDNLTQKEVGEHPEYGIEFDEELKEIDKELEEEHNKK